MAMYILTFPELKTNSLAMGFLHLWPVVKPTNVSSSMVTHYDQQYSHSVTSTKKSLDVNRGVTHWDGFGSLLRYCLSARHRETWWCSSGSGHHHSEHQGSDYKSPVLRTAAKTHWTTSWGQRELFIYAVSVHNTILVYWCFKFTGIVHPKYKFAKNALTFRTSSIYRWVCLFIKTCSPMDPLLWMGAVRIRVQTADKHITIIHTTPVHQLTSCKWKVAYL